MRIPEEYVSNIAERLSLYKQLDEIETEEKLQDFASQLKDRFGAVPNQVYALMATIRLRWLARKLGFEKIVLKNKTLKAYFISKQDSAYYQTTQFGTVIKYIQSNPRLCKMKEEKGKLSLTLLQIDSVEEALRVLDRMKEGAEAKT